MKSFFLLLLKKKSFRLGLFNTYTRYKGKWKLASQMSGWRKSALIFLHSQELSFPSPTLHALEVLFMKHSSLFRGKTLSWRNYIVRDKSIVKHSHNIKNDTRVKFTNAWKLSNTSHGFHIKFITVLPFSIKLSTLIQ